MNTLSKKSYDYIAAVTVGILVVGLYGFQLMTVWFIAPIFLVLIFTYYQRLQFLEKAKAKSALITLVGLLSILGLFLIYNFWLI